MEVWTTKLLYRVSPKKWGLTIWFGLILIWLVNYDCYNIMVSCSCQFFSTHFTCHRAEVASKLPHHGLTSFWLFLLCLQGHRLYKKVTFQSSFNNNSFFNGWSELLKKFKQGKHFTTLTFTTDNIFRYFGPTMSEFHCHKMYEKRCLFYRSVSKQRQCKTCQFMKGDFQL